MDFICLPAWPAIFSNYLASIRTFSFSFPVVLLTGSYCHSVYSCTIPPDLSVASSPSATFIGSEPVEQGLSSSNCCPSNILILITKYVSRNRHISTYDHFLRKCSLNFLRIHTRTATRISTIFTLSTFLAGDLRIGLTVIRPKFFNSVSLPMNSIDFSSN